MPAPGSRMCSTLLILGAYGLVDSTLAFQVRSPGPTQDTLSGYVSKLKFVLVGTDYTSLSTDTAAVGVLTSSVAGSVSGSMGLQPSDCRVALGPPPSTLSVGAVAVEVSIAGSSLAAAEATTAQLASMAGAILPGVLSDPQLQPEVVSHGTPSHYESISVSTEFVIDFPSPAPTPAPTPPPPLATAIGDPHLASVTGKRFDVNMPGSHVLIRVPQDRRLPAKLELNATLQASPRAPCGLYIKGVELGGEWLGGQVVGVVPLQRDAEGQNGAGSGSLRAFSVRVGASGEYEEWGHLGKEGRSLSGRVRLVPMWRQVYADAGRPQEAQAFQFHIRGDGEGHGAVLEAAQAAHQALDFSAGGLNSLGFESLGGLLGTEEHDKQIEQASDECRAFQTKPGQEGARIGRPVLPGSKMTAAWDAHF